MKSRTQIACVLMLLLPLGCAPVFPSKQSVAMPDTTKPIENTKKARLYVFRPSHEAGAWGIRVYDGDTKIGVLLDSGYLCWERDPGEVYLHDDAENKSQFLLTVEAGHVYYLHQATHKGWTKPRTNYEEIPEEKAQEYLRVCQPAKLKLD
jgi:hypothetical protein